MKLIIFDLDQTLVDVVEVHIKALTRVFQEFFQVEAALNDIDFAGKSLTQIFEEMAAQKNIPYDIFKQSAIKLLEDYELHFIQNFSADATGYVLPGAKKLLALLSKSDNNILALYTGNSARIVDKVLTATRLKKFFKFCFYGTEVESRADMVEMSIEKAEKLVGKRFRGKDIVIIGDSVRDVECGKQFNALTIAVTTGFHSAEQLRKHHPDHIFPDLKDTAAILKAIG